MKLSFEQWMARVDAIISDACGGFTSADLPDCCYRDWFNDRVSPKSAAKRAMAME